MTIHDKARKLVQQSGSPMSLERAYQILGRRGAQSRRAKQAAKTTQAQAYWWQKD